MTAALTMTDLQGLLGTDASPEAVLRAANAVLQQRGLKAPSKVDFKLSYTVDETALALGLSAATVWAMLKAGELSAKRLRGRTLVPREELQRVLDEAPSARAA